MANDAAAAPAPRWADPRPWAWVLAAVPAALAVAELGRLHPDEVYQFLEPAYVRVHGYGVLAWEWRQGLRNWAAPLLLAAVMRAGGWLGIADPWWVRSLLAVPLAALQGWGLLAAARLGLRRAGGWGGWCALLAVGLLPLYRVVAGRTLGEALSAALLVVAAEALSRDTGSGAAACVGGLALGLAFVVRYGSLPAMALAALWLAAHRRWRLLTWAGVGLLAVVLALGVLDWASWGRPWHSVGAWAAFNVLSDGAAKTFGREPAGYYVPFLFGQATALGVAGARPDLLALPVGRRPRRARWPWPCSSRLQTTAHKEERFLYPVVVLLVLEAAPGLGALLRSRATYRCSGGGGGAGPGDDLPRGSARRSISEGTSSGRWSARRDLARSRVCSSSTRGCGARVASSTWASASRGSPATGPTTRNFVAAVRDPRFNRAISFEGRAIAELESAGFHVVGQEGRETVLAR